MTVARHEQATSGLTADATPTRAGRAAPLSVVDASFVQDPALALLQQHQARQITPDLTGRAGRRLQDALTKAEQGRACDPDRLLREVLTDLGITLALP